MHKTKASLALLINIIRSGCVSGQFVLLALFVCLFVCFCVCVPGSCQCVIVPPERGLVGLLPCLPTNYFVATGLPVNAFTFFMNSTLLAGQETKMKRLQCRDELYRLGKRTGFSAFHVCCWIPEIYHIYQRHQKTISFKGEIVLP